MNRGCRSGFKTSKSAIQWRSYTRAHTGPGPGEFLSALVNHARSTYLNRNSIAVYVKSWRIKLPMPLIYDFSFVNFSSKYEPQVLKTEVKVHLVMARGQSRNSGYATAAIYLAVYDHWTMDWLIEIGLTHFHLLLRPTCL